MPRSISRSISHARMRPVRAVGHALAFTLTEMMIAVGVLVVVIVATAQIFGSASKVTAIAEANAELLQTAAAIESQIRADFANLPKNGFMVIQQVEVNANGGGQTLDPSLGTSEIRADQIAFFTHGVRQTQQYLGSQQGSRTPNPAEPTDPNLDIINTWPQESAVARIYYGHGILASTLPTNFGPTTYLDSNAPVVPWIGGAVETERWDTAAAGPPGRVALTKPSLWPLARLATLMANDGVQSYGYALDSSAAATGVSKNASMRLFTDRTVKTAPMGTVNPPLGEPLWTSGRVDIVKWLPDDLFSQMAYQYGTNNQPIAGAIPYILQLSPWSGPSVRLRMIQTLGSWATPATRANPTNGAGQLYVSYPRVEKAALSQEKSDLMLTSPVLAPNCSSFKVEWTWADGTGQSENGASTGRTGIVLFPGYSQPWFGLDDLSLTLAQSPVKPVSNMNTLLDNESTEPWGAIEDPLVLGRNQDVVVSCNVEGVINRNPITSLKDRPVWPCDIDQGAKRVYQAVFGFNQSDPSKTNPSTSLRGPYTPLPSALRITVRLHDALGRLEGGREFQFIIELPKL